MLFKTNATSIQQLKSYVKRMARHRRANKSCLLWTIQTPTNTILTQWNRLMSFVLKIVKRNLIEEYPCQNRKQPEKKEGEYIENDKNCLSKCIVGGSRKSFAMPQESITSNSKNNIQMEKNNQTTSWEKTKYKQEETLEK